MPAGDPQKGKRRLVPATDERPARPAPPEQKPPQPPARQERQERQERPAADRAGSPPRGGKGGKGGKGRGGPGGPGGKRRGPPRDVDPVLETMAPTTIPALRARERRMHVVSNLPSDPRFGKDPETRTIEERLRLGVIILDKPRGPTSHQVVAWLRDILDVKRVGHGGTLDPKVSGVLPTTLGEGTKAVSALLTSGKEYVAVMRLHGDADEATIRDTARRFIGKVRQVPPVRSAVARRPRTRRIYDLEVLQVDGRDVLFRVQSEAGTYIRNLCVDLGKAIGTRGHMSELRRTRTGLLGEDEAVTLTDVKDAVHAWRDDGDDAPLRAMVHPIERILAHLPQIRLRDSAVDAVCHGAELAAPGLAAVEEGIQKGDLVALVTGKGEAVGLATASMASDDMVSAQTGVVAVAERVLMRPGTYPSTWKKKRTETRQVG